MLLSSLFSRSIYARNEEKRPCIRASSGGAKVNPYSVDNVGVCLCVCVCAFSPWPLQAPTCQNINIERDTRVLSVVAATRFRRGQRGGRTLDRLFRTTHTQRVARSLYTGPMTVPVPVPSSTHPSTHLPLLLSFTLFFFSSPFYCFPLSFTFPLHPPPFLPIHPSLFFPLLMPAATRNKYKSFSHLVAWKNIAHFAKKTFHRPGVY